MIIITKQKADSVYLHEVYIDEISVGLGSKRECEMLEMELRCDRIKAEFVKRLMSDCQ